MRQLLAQIAGPRLAAPGTGTTTNSEPAPVTVTTPAFQPKPKRKPKPSPAPGRLPQTDQLPSAVTPEFKAEMRALWTGVLTNSVATALPTFFPKPAYSQLKAIGDPQDDFARRLVNDFRLDLAAAHALLKANSGSAQLVAVDVTQAHAHWVAPGVCYNRVGYYEVPNARVGWIPQGVGTWTDPANWQLVSGQAGLGYPNATDATAEFATTGRTQTVTIPVGTQITVGSSDFRSSQPFVIAGGVGAGLTIAGPGQVDAGAGRDQVTVPVTLATPLTASVSLSAMLTFSASLVGPAGVTETGGGVLALTAPNTFNGG